ncbi:MAG: hypothetical protein K1X28_10235, partial [Parachlamydiales bacterium]|nr:hypothetical protein [Parachlamydiales bacterium]
PAPKEKGPTEMSGLFYLRRKTPVVSGVLGLELSLPACWQRSGGKPGVTPAPFFEEVWRASLRLSRDFEEIVRKYGSTKLSILS